jgi:hypothetical protein
MSLLASIDDFQTGTYTVTRTPAGSYVNGRYTPGTPATFTITAVVEPSSGREIKVLPEGQFAEDVKVLYTATELFTMSPTSVPDTIAIGGDNYSVAKIDGPWIMPDSTHYRVYVARQRVP